ncbi:cytochrome c oxidase assembly protein COX16 homolog, mitochondrial-like [Corticium candelabrum]|uniref:cytochrome c oxidase assembly protein COX16 homolog, mitochondrial-like n=1 Tax=Corticium candelabrum TaxID=121492 RepID=UPI002E25D754|nr:cytochrome c oxidase assembly protein COX16 homolog, mitochondrial-like [Corticium candelabrum]
MLQFLRRSKFLKIGFPFLLFVVGGSFGLAEFAAVGVDRKDEKTRTLTSEEVRQLQTGKQTTLEELHQELQKKLDINEWENVRVPRPWDE